MNFYAHTLPGIADQTRWEPMHQHETAVADLRGSFLGRLHPDLRSWGEQLGRWHDLGKYSAAFQAYLLQAGVTEASTETRRGRVNRSSAGAQHASSTLGKIGHLLAYCIAGHHAGLPDWISRTGSPQSGLQHRLQANIEDISAAPKELLQAKSQASPSRACDSNHLRSPRSQDNHTNLGTRHPTPQATAKQRSKFGKLNAFTIPTRQSRLASEPVWQARISPLPVSHELASRASKFGKRDPLLALNTNQRSLVPRNEESDHGETGLFCGKASTKPQSNGYCTELCKFGVPCPKIFCILFRK